MNNWDKIMESIKFPDSCIEEQCPKLVRTEDGYGTGDSPAVYECEEVYATRCPFFEKICTSVNN